MSNPASKTWRLRAGADRRFRSGHPWVYSNELSESPKGLEPGAPVELRDAAGKFLARGYGNPSSLIAFRAMSRSEGEADPASAEGLLARLKDASATRRALGLSAVSHRLCFGEADRLPGLIIDRYRLAGEPARQALVVQPHTAGMNRLMGVLPEVLKALVESEGAVAWAQTALVIRNDVGIRKLEGLDEEAPRVAKAIEGVDLVRCKILVPGAQGNREFIVDLSEGQKTGFFLDQVANVQLAAARLLPEAVAEGKKVRILDLCCYVGQWSAQLAAHFRKAGLEVEVTLVDASAKALELAKANVEATGARCAVIKGDVLKDLTTLADDSFELVIADPPALIKGRKDIPAGTHAYLQLNTQAMRLARRAIVSCSCSALLEEEEFLKALSKAASRNRANVRWIARGSQSPDHPVLAEFPEGRYLKAWIGLISKEKT